MAPRRAPEQEPDYSGPAGALRRMADQLEQDIETLDAEADAFERRAATRRSAITEKQDALREMRAAADRLEQADRTASVAAEPASGEDGTA